MTNSTNALPDNVLDQFITEIFYALPAPMSIAEPINILFTFCECFAKGLQSVDEHVFFSLK